MDSYAVSSLMASMRAALQAVAPVLERTGIRHRPDAVLYDGWEKLEAQVFDSLIGDLVELTDAHPLAEYGFSFEEYSERSFVSLADEGGETLALVRFSSVVESFDTLLAARLHPDTLVVTGTARVPFEAARFALSANSRSGIRSFDHLSY